MNEQGHSDTSSSNCDSVILKDHQIQKEEFIKEDMLDSNGSDSSSSQIKIIISEDSETDLNNKNNDSESNKPIANEQRSSVIVQPSRIAVLTDNKSNDNKLNEEIENKSNEIDKNKSKLEDDKPKNEEKPSFLCESKLSQSIINNLFNSVKQQAETSSSNIKLRPSVLRIGESTSLSNEKSVDSTKLEESLTDEKPTNKDSTNNSKESASKPMTNLFKFAPLTDNKKPTFGSFNFENNSGASTSSTQSGSSFSALAGNTVKSSFLTDNDDKKATSTNYFTANLFQTAVAQTSSSNNSLESSDTFGFVFGQNLQDRVTNVSDKSSATQPVTSHSKEANSSLSINLTNEKTVDSNIATSSTNNAPEKRKFENITGEEEETNVMHIYCKLFQWDSESSAWKERGKGNLRLNDKYDEERTTSRLIMRTTGSFKLILNCLIISGMKFELTNNCIRFSNVHGIYLVKGKQNDIEQIYSLIEQRLKMLPKRRPEIKQTEEDDKSLENSFAIKERLKLNKDNDEESIDMHKYEGIFKIQTSVHDEKGEKNKKVDKDKCADENKQINDEIKKDNCIKANEDKKEHELYKKDEIKNQEL